jgi:hypothetical protein
MLSRKFNTIFVHVPKAAGQSIELLFVRAEGLAWGNREPLLLRKNEKPGEGPEYLAHLLAREYVQYGYVGPGDFASFFKFAVVRHPFDRYLSEYRWRLTVTPLDRPLPTMEALWRMRNAPPHMGVARHLARQADYVTGEDGKVIVDRVLRYETLDQEIEPVLRQLLGTAPPLPVINRTPGPVLGRDALSDQMKRELYRHYEVDFDLFGYSPND